jgi:hypothetical protein
LSDGIPAPLGIGMRETDRGTSLNGFNRERNGGADARGLARVAGRAGESLI